MEPLLEPEKNEKDETQLHSPVDEDLCIRSNTKLEFPDLCGIFLGEFGKKMYGAIIIVIFYGTLAAYISVFSNTFSFVFSFTSNSELNFYIYLAIFACVTIPLSCLDLYEQVNTQY